jgi:ATP-dependent DNA helicase RecQ
VLPTRNEQEKDDALVQTLRDHEGVAVIYASTRRNVERIAGVLERARVSATAYHAGLDDAHRHDVQESFMNERVRAIVATNAFGMGIDKPNVRLVVHHAMPGTLEAYYQEAGRAGRDGNHSECVLLHSFPDRFTHEFFIKGAYPERPVIESVYDALRRVVDASGMTDLARLTLRGSCRVRSETATSIRCSAFCFAPMLCAGNRSRDRRYDPPPGYPGSASSVSCRTRTAQELGLLRALWRAVGARLHDGRGRGPRRPPAGLQRRQHGDSTAVCAAGPPVSHVGAHRMAGLGSLTRKRPLGVRC